MCEKKLLSIGIVLPQLPGYSETFFVNKIKGLKEEGHNVFLFVTGKKKSTFNLTKVYYGPYLSKYKFLNIYVSAFSIFKLALKSPLTAVKFLKLERKNGASWMISLKRLVINSHILPHKLDWLHFGYAVMGIERELVGKAIGAKVGLSLRGHDIFIYPLKHPGCYKKLWNNIDKVHTISDALLKEAFNIGLHKTIRSEKITPAIDHILFHSDRKKYFLGETIKIITVARLHWIKGLEHTLEALALVKEKGIKLKYTIIGDGPGLESLIYAQHQLDLDDNIEFQGRVDITKIPCILKTKDIYLQYSLQEGFCNSVLEAQAARLLCIVSDADGLSENVIDGITGWVVPKRMPDLLAQKILDVLNMPQQKLLDITNRAAERVRTEFDLEEQRKKFIDFYSKT